MKTIWKFVLEVTDEQSIEIPKDHEILTVQTQRNQPFIWAIVDPESEREEIHLRTFGTGQPIIRGLDGYRYIGSYQLDNGSFVGHLFENRADSLIVGGET